MRSDYRTDVLCGLRALRAVTVRPAALWNVRSVFRPADSDAAGPCGHRDDAASAMAMMMMMMSLSERPGRLAPRSAGLDNQAPGFIVDYSEPPGSRDERPHQNTLIQPDLREGLFSVWIQKVPDQCEVGG
ncbi:hypothetical protein AAFF_G00428800 [Aldrovandia affinis]|uniref:Uncharacterized protein n=1 Tax=Aldrovandia affinis TaxID=143900 RepID=A0AAD7WIW2_9TELE|nr:hypothetical protein AAFF_G00428800 [Aldrovandia affinis]